MAVQKNLQGWINAVNELWKNTLEIYRLLVRCKGHLAGQWNQGHRFDSRLFIADSDESTISEHDCYQKF